LAQEIRDSMNLHQKKEEAAEVESAYSELVEDEQSQDEAAHLIAVPNALCSVCGIEKESCIILTTRCRHQACIDCIEAKITLPIQSRLEQREKVSVDEVMCKAAEWCENIMPLEILLPLLNLNEEEDVERIHDLYEDSICCIGEDNVQFVDQQKWMAHCMVCHGKFCVVCVNSSEQKAVRPSLAQCRCVRCPQCDSANTVARQETYYCHSCNQNFCWSCHNTMEACVCG
jgi:hypothetical protein